MSGKLSASILARLLTLAKQLFIETFKGIVSTKTI